MSDFATKACLLCGLTISANPQKNHPTAFLAGKCNGCWAKIKPQREIRIAPEVEDLDLLDDLKHVRCSLCKTRLDPKKILCVALNSEKCNDCWQRLQDEDREITPATASQRNAITFVDTSAIGWSGRRT